MESYREVCFKFTLSLTLSALTGSLLSYLKQQVKLSRFCWENGHKLPFLEGVWGSITFVKVVYSLVVF